MRGVITKKRIMICLLSLVLGFLVAACSVVAYAYFSKKEIYDGYVSGQVELLFDRLNEEGLTAYGQAEGITADKEADWGTEENPYVISNVRHLYNLSELQNLGYFERKHLVNNTETDLTHIPYFLICTPDYTPVLIDGSSFKAISPIGNGEHPFIGSVKGVTGSPGVTVLGNASDTSVLHGISVKGNPANADAGLFGYVGFLGTPPEEGATEEVTFLGTPSVISNMILSDVTVAVDSSLWDAVESFIVDIALDAMGHRYSYSDLYNESDTTDYDSVPHENHHIGILAGHVSYSTVEYISVYYSSGDVVAMDLSDTTDIGGDKANYLSAAGILGFIYNLNPSFDEGTGQITAGSGDSIGDLSYSMVGGGGLQSGAKAGYVLASKMYSAYGYTAADTPIADGSALNISKATDKQGNNLCHEWIRENILGLGTTATGEYYFYDGVFTFALSTQNDVIDSTWEGGVPEFAIGGTNAEDWHANTSEGNKSVSAYIKQIKSDADLQAAIESGSPLVIMKDVDASNVFLMSLYRQSTAGDGNFNQKYTTPGTSKKYATDEKIADLLESFYGSEESKQDFIDGFGEGFDEAKVEEILGHLQNDADDETWKVISLNATPGNLSTEELEAEVKKLRLEYKILSSMLSEASDEESFAYFAANTPVTVGSGKLNDYYDYASSGYNGYFVYTQYRTLGTRYAYHWIPLDGSDPVELDSDSRNAPNAFFTISTGETWEGENVYTRQNTAYKGVIVNTESSSFYSTDHTANASGSSLTKPTGEVIGYFFRLPGSNDCYYASDLLLQDPIPVSSLANTGEVSGADLPIYSYGTNEGVLLDRYYEYDFYSNGIDESGKASENYLRMIKATVPSRVFNIPLINLEIPIGSKTEYTLWNGNDDAAKEPDNFKIGNSASASNLLNSTRAIVKFNTDGTCYIQYTIDGVSQYVNYNGSAFNTALSTSDGTKLSIYSLEATQAINYGTITFDPNDNTDSHTFRADEYVFWPEGTVEVNTAGTESSVTYTDVDYSVVSLESLLWNNGNAADNGGVLHGGNLTKKFHMIDGISFGATIDLGGSIGTDGFIRAPVGTAGTQTDIPTGCVAFRVNKTSTEAQKIRVIIAVPASDFYVGEEWYDLGDYERYFCLWEMNESGGGGLQLQLFRADEYIERFAIPRSHPYEPGTASDSPNSEYVTAKYNNTTYRSYLNGDRVLLAYEFKVYSEGVYVLGTSTSSSDESLFADKDIAPMEIVYFSADGVASTGRDGLSGSQLGTVDYVYSYNNTIVPVTESSSTDSEGNEDYSTFYPSYCILYMNSVQDASAGVFVNVNSELIYVRRYITDENPPTSSDGYTTTTSGSVIEFHLERDKYAKLSQYSRIADNVKEKE